VENKFVCSFVKKVLGFEGVKTVREPAPVDTRIKVIKSRGRRSWNDLWEV